MKTRQMFSGINYNTHHFLKAKLDELYDNRWIDYYMFIHHKKENGKNAEFHENKDHTHVILYPARQIDTRDLLKEFAEFTKDNPLPLNFTKLFKIVHKDKDLEWLLYILHDPIYCRAKCMEKQYTYTPAEIISNDDDVRDDLLFRAYHETEFYHDKSIQDKIIKQNMNGSDLITNGYVPISKACGYHHYMQMLKGG